MQYVAAERVERRRAQGLLVDLYLEQMGSTAAAQVQVAVMVYRHRFNEQFLSMPQSLRGLRRLAFGQLDCSCNVLFTSLPV